MTVIVTTGLETEYVEFKLRMPRLKEQAEEAIYVFYNYLEGNVTVPEEVLIKLVQGQVKAELKKEG